MKGRETQSVKGGTIGISSCSVVGFGQRGCALCVIALCVQGQAVPPNPHSAGCTVTL